MSATDELRRLLDERGVAHSDHYFSTTWRDGRGILHLASEQMTDNSLVVDKLTPEQAILVTLGSGESNIAYKGNLIWQCQSCGEEMRVMLNMPNYCPHCGKKAMR